MNQQKSNGANNGKDQLVENLYRSAAQNNRIEPYLFDYYDVKRGLRNNDGTGVLVGLTQIGDVHGYIMDKGKKVPVEGCLRYRGINVEDIIQNCQEEDRFGFEEVCFLLLFGKLPDKKELAAFCEILGTSRILPDNFLEDVILKTPSKNVMNKLERCILSCYSYDENPDDMSTNQVLSRCIDLTAQVPVFVAYSYMAKCHYIDNKSLLIHNPEEKLSTAECLLHMIRPDSQFTKVEADILDLSLILHAEHGGGNNSTFVTRVATSSGTDTYSAIAAGVGALKGPKHGGANIKVMEMVEDLKKNVLHWEREEAVKEYLIKILNREAFDREGLVYGMGHAVYTLSDPRAILLKKKAKELAEIKNMENEFALYDTIETVTSELFAERKGSALCANLDLYSGFVYKMLDIPMDLYTAIFAIARTPSWCAHSIEEQISGGKIIRPAYNTLIQIKDYKPLNER
ncbi:MAG TPA: citrate synthase [Clostridiales bacterium]|nr:citrate/2-methylcitrate synthase [Clostridia bacterium]MDD4679729.1 citrate/2-methylcitrate synthase [Clostridia bacterium]HCS75311.1 citrate synthase [Clostridiales bacterium]